MRLLRHPTRFPEERDGAWSRRRASAFSRHFRCRFSVRRACSPPVRPSVRPPASFQIARFKREDARTATAPPLTRSLGRTFAWAPQAAARLLLCLARPPRPSNATRPPTFLPSFSPKRYPPLPPTSGMQYAVPPCATVVPSLSPVFPRPPPPPSIRPIHLRHFSRRCCARSNTWPRVTIRL